MERFELTTSQVQDQSADIMLQKTSLNTFNKRDITKFIKNKKNLSDS
jgi:hypothetical protein